MIEAEVMSPPKRPSKKYRWIGAILVAILILLGLYAWSVNQGASTRYRFVNPGEGGSSRVGPIPVEASPELAAAGVAAEYVSQGARVHQIAFIRRDEVSVTVEITAGKQAIEQDDLSYVLIGQNGEELSKGKLKLSTALQPGAKGNGAIDDGLIPSAARIVIRK